MNYNGGNTSDGWEALLLNSFGFTTTLTDGTDNTSGDRQHQAASGYSNSSTSANSNAATGGGGGAGGVYDPLAYVAYLQNNYNTTVPPSGAAVAINNYYSNDYSTGSGAVSAGIGSPFGYSGGYSLTMPATMNLPAAAPPQAGGGGQRHLHSPHATDQYTNSAPSQSQNLHQTTADRFADYSAYFNNTMASSQLNQQNQQQQNHSGIMQPQQQQEPQQQQQPHNTATFGDDFCDLLLQGLDEPSLTSYLTGGINGPTPPTTNASTVNNYNSYQRQQQHSQQQQSLPFTTMRGSCGGGVIMGGQQSRSNHQNPPNSYHVYMTQHQKKQPPSTTASSYHNRNSSSPRTMSTTTTTAAAAAAAVAATTSSLSYYRSPNETDHSSEPVAQIDPLLEKVSLRVTAVSLEPLSGNEVVRHIMTKTDDVITRFLPCVDFLVNCQQELRQGLQVAQRRRVVSHGRGTRTTPNMSPRQFHTTYVAPLPRRFERTNKSIMAGEHLNSATLQLQQLVKDSALAIPLGCDHVKNAFLGGMRENESWGLRKWLSKHGGAGSICNDLEEVMRMVKALKKDDETTKRLAEILRPIASQAHDRLKKDIPQAYQEQSSAHPYLPFFHRLEACLKQMATYDPDDDDVICLDDSDDEDDVVAVVVPLKSESNGDVVSAPVKTVTTPVKRGSDYDDATSMFNDECYTKKSRPEEDEKMSSSTKKADQEIICLDDSSDEDDDKEDNNNDNNNNNGTVSKGGKSSYYQPQLPPSPSPLPQAAMPVAYKNSAEKCEGDKWRCRDCTFLNSATSFQCEMCQEDDSDGADELANFLGGSFFVDGSLHFP